MVKFANKPKGRPTKRKTLKTKYKIQRKVKQYRKKLKKQAKNLKEKGIRHKKNPDRDNLPNTFPLKQKMLQEFKASLPKQPEAPIETLSAPEFGLVTLQNKPVYFPKGRDNLTKKYITNLDAIIKKAKVVLQVLDSRNPQICIDHKFRNLCAKEGIQRITVVSKIDTIYQKQLIKIEERMKDSKEKYVQKFTHDNKYRKQLVQNIVRSIKNLKEEMGIEQEKNISVFVAGKANTGKHTLISSLCRYAGKYQDIPSELFQLILFPGVKLIDAPYKIQDQSAFPLFHVPSDLNKQVSQTAQEETVLRQLFFGGLAHYKGPVLNRNQILQYYLIQDFTSVQDLCKKVGKALRIFGKGGMIDVQKVKQKILCDWFTGRHNKFINPMKQL